LYNEKETSTMGGTGQGENVLLSPYSCDWWLYKERHLVECFFNKLQHFRRVAIRYDKLAESFFAFVLLASIFVLLK
ncbi:MAG: hypothetical protein RR821_06240, partial [Clostridia bacterium]